jgi:hypothetical protein
MLIYLHYATLELPSNSSGDVFAPAGINNPCKEYAKLHQHLSILATYCKLVQIQEEMGGQIKPELHEHAQSLWRGHPSSPSVPRPPPLTSNTSKFLEPTDITKSA